MFNLNLIFCVFLAVFVKSGWLKILWNSFEKKKLIILVIFIKGLAIQCYMCDSSSNPGCHKLEAGHKVRLEVKALYYRWVRIRFKNLLKTFKGFKLGYEILA